MKLRVIKKFLFISTLIIWICLANVYAQRLTYSSENVFVNNPDQLELAANISGNSHLLSFIYNENPQIFIFDKSLELLGKIKLMYKFPERSEVHIIPFDKYYYLLIHPPLNSKYFLWRIDGQGNVTDLSLSFQKLIATQFAHSLTGFKLIENKNELYLIFHTYMSETEKNQTTILQLDTSLNVLFTNNILYDLKRHEERLQEEIFEGGKDLFVLKTSRNSMLLQIIKINILTGYTITNTFASAGSAYAGCSLKYNSVDSSILVYAVLRQLSSPSSEKSIFISKLDNSLMEEIPFAIVKSPFPKNIPGGFFLVDGSEQGWINFGRATTTYITYETTAATTNLNPFANTFQDYTNSDPRNTVSDPRYNNSNDPRYSPNAPVYTPIIPARTQVKYTESNYQGIHFSVLDKKFKIANDSTVSNSKNSYTLFADRAISFTAKHKNYILLSQQFFKKNKGLLMVSSDNNSQLVFTNVRVNDRNDYLLSQSQTIPQQGIIIPYTHKREAGLVRITIE